MEASKRCGGERWAGIYWGYGFEGGGGGGEWGVGGGVGV
jgi:hypothetical protein